LATSITARPPTRTIASVSSTGTDTVTGAHSSSAVAAPSTTALRAKIRQNNDTARSFPFPATIAVLPDSYFRKMGAGPDRQALYGRSW
jgi:hypothetical protein